LPITLDKLQRSSFGIGCLQRMPEAAREYGMARTNLEIQGLTVPSRGSRRRVAFCPVFGRGGWM